MTNALKSLQNNTLAAVVQRAPSGVLNAIKSASAKTGVDFAYLMEKAAAESSFKPDAKAKTSSATGLFQFIESTWMGMVKEHGAKYGIDTTLDKKSLLELRKDPQIASFMAAEFAKDNQTYLEKTIGGDIGNTELYFAHFMGVRVPFYHCLRKIPWRAALIFSLQPLMQTVMFFMTRKRVHPKHYRPSMIFLIKSFKRDQATRQSKRRFALQKMIRRRPILWFKTRPQKKDINTSPPHLKSQLKLLMGAAIAFINLPMGITVISDRSIKFKMSLIHFSAKEQSYRPRHFTTIKQTQHPSC